MCFIFCRFWLIDIFIFPIPRVYTQVTSTQKSKYSNAYQVTRDITIATLYLLYGPFINMYKHLHTHTHIHIHRQIYVCFQRILKAFIWQLNKGFNFKFLALKTKQGLQNSYYDPWHFNTSLAFSKYEPSN